MLWKKRKDILKKQDWESLKRHAEDVGIFFHYTKIPNLEAGKIVDKIIQAENNIYLARTWRFSLISAIAAVISALAAWFANIY